MFYKTIDWRTGLPLTWTQHMDFDPEHDLTCASSVAAIYGWGKATFYANIEKRPEEFSYIQWTPVEALFTTQQRSRNLPVTCTASVRAHAALWQERARAARGGPDRDARIAAERRVWRVVGGEG